MTKPAKVLLIDLDRPIQDLDGLNEYRSVRAIVRWNSTPVCYVDVPLDNGNCSASALRATILRVQQNNLLRHLIRHELESGISIDGGQQDIAAIDQRRYADDNSLRVTVAVCTRDRAQQLRDCLDSLRAVDYANLEVLVVDNAPSNTGTRELVEQAYPEFHYVLEPRPGLDWARNRAIIESSGDILAYTDDDVVVDPHWVSGLAGVFRDDPSVMAVTGLVVPFEMETEAQALFERYGGFGRGFKRIWYRMNFADKRASPIHIGAGRFGTGANMAYRRSVFDRIGYFDPALDVGTVTNGGGDLEMFFRVLEEGHTLVYEPAALVWHKHRRTYQELHSQLTNHGIGLYSHFVRSAIHYPRRRAAIIRFGLWWFWHWDVRRLLKSFVSRPRVPRDLIIAELRGAITGLTRYQKARRRAEQISTQYPDEPGGHAGSSPQSGAREQAKSMRHNLPVAIRCVDIRQQLTAIDDIANYRSCRVYVFHGDRLLGMVDLANANMPLSPTRLRDAIADQLHHQIAGLMYEDNAYEPELTLLERRLAFKADEHAAGLAKSVSVSIALATYDRPEQLQECLQALSRQETSRRLEIIVIDNHPASGKTPPVVARFPDVVLVSEPRQGLAYARNAGFVRATGDIVIATDDDVIMPTDWAEKMVAPFERSDIGIVTGNVLPRELETEYQYLFEAYGGLGRGFRPAEFGPAWFRASRRRAAPTWQLGATANAAFRASLLRNPAIGLMDEALGPGMPSGVGEDTYLFYRIIKAGYSLVYRPDAFVWHTHRRDARSLRKQIYNYSKGHIAYHLTTLLRDGDRRALHRLFLNLPRTYLKRIYRRLRGRSDYPISLILLEIAGNLAGPWTLWRSRQRVRREGRSAFPDANSGSAAQGGQ